MSKRIRARVGVHLKVEYRHAGGQGQGMLMDLAVQGCRIQGAARFSCGAIVRLRIWLPDQAEPVTVERAVVRWTKDDEFGLTFTEMSPDTRACLAQVVQLLHEEQQPAAQVLRVSGCFVASREQNAVSPPPEMRVRIDHV